MRYLKLFIGLTRIREFYGTVLILTFFGLVLSSNPSFAESIILLFANMLCTCFVFGFNDLEDRDDDKLSIDKRNRNLLANGSISTKSASIVLSIIASASLILYLSIDIEVFVLGCLGIILGFLYSYSRIRLKSKPILDLLSHGYFFGLIYIVIPIAAFGTNSPQLTVWYGLCVFILSAIVDLNNEVRDINLDKKSKLSNTVIYFRLDRLASRLILLWMVVLGLFLVPILYIGSTELRVLICMIVFVALLLLYKLRKQIKTSDYRYDHQQSLLAMSTLILLVFV